MADQKSTSKGDELLECLAAIASDVAGRVLGVDQELAKLVADEVATKFSDDFGGQICYVPKGWLRRTSALHRQIWERFTGSNHGELAREFGVSMAHIYRVIAREKERERADRQPPLPGMSS